MGTDLHLAEHDLSAYRADPQGEPRGAVVVVQEIWGLTPHIRDVADRLAAEGYVAVAPDLLGHVGLTPEVGTRIFELANSASEEDRLAAQPQLREATTPARQPEFAAWAVPALSGVVDLLEVEPALRGRVAVVGFCFGGTYAFALAAADDRVRAAVPFYGTFPEGADPAGIACPVLAFYGEDDHRVTDGVPDLEERMGEAGVDFTARVYHGVGHAFFNDDAPSRHHPDVAADAWQRTLAFLAGHLGG